MSVLTAEPLSQVCRADLRWLWEPYVPRGRLAVLDGNPGVGKSLITIDLAARLSRGGELPGGKRPERPHVTLLLGSEDNTADTVRPRAEAAGADLDRVHIVSAAGERIFFPERIAELEELIRARSADLVVIDPVMAFLPPEVAATLDQCVRRALNPLAMLAERTDCAILMVRHLRKTGSPLAVHRGQGSMGMIGVARAGLLAGPHPTDEEVGILAVTKANVTAPVLSLSYRVKADAESRAVVEWLEQVELTADEMGRREAPLRMRDQAIAWLIEALSHGPRIANELYAQAAAVSIPERTLRRARSDLGVKTHKHRIGDRGIWYWYDSSVPWPKDTPFKKPDPFELPPLEFD